MKQIFTYQLIGVLLFVTTFLGCTDDYVVLEKKQPSILLLQVDYGSNDFEGGFTYEYEQSTTPFNYNIDYQQPGDFGSVKIFHVGVEDLLFEGSIIWAGTGERIKPETLDAAEQFGISDEPVDDQLVNGFENIFNPGDQEFDFQPAWDALTNLQITQNYLEDNQQNIHYFLYQPSVGLGNPDDWKWIVFLYK